MEFVKKLPKTKKGHDMIWVIVDRLTKSALFLAVKETWPIERFAELYVREVVRRHGVCTSIVSNRDSQFTYHFWKSMKMEMGTNLCLSITYHPQTDGQSERTIQIVEFRTISEHLKL